MKISGLCWGLGKGYVGWGEVGLGKDLVFLEGIEKKLVKMDDSE